jgi:hypothetical protein
VSTTTTPASTTTNPVEDIETAVVPDLQFLATLELRQGLTTLGHTGLGNCDSI